MKNSKFILSFFILYSLNSFGAENVQFALNNADSLYDKGDCEKAIRAFNSIQGTDLNQDQKDKILFRVSYCHFSLAHYQDSENGFKNYLNLHPNADEARLKYAQSLLYQSKNSLAEEAALKINSPSFKADAAIVIARSLIENENYKKAIMTLSPYVDNSESMYWAALACYRSDLDVEAETYFKLAAKKSNTDSWVHTESNLWLKRIEGDKRRLHLRLTLGALHDSNIDQSGGSGTIGNGQDGPGGPGMTKPTFSTANYTSDTGKYLAVDFIHNTYSARKLSLTTTVSAASPFYTNHPTYNQESLGLDLNLRATPSSTFNYGASLKYQDTFYNKIYSQDYVYFTPSASWSFTSDYWLKFSVPVTQYLNNKQIKLLGGNLDLYYDATSWLSLSLGASSTKSTAPEAVVVKNGQEDKLISGTMFSHYTSTGAYLGMTVYIGETWQLGLTGSSYKTKYVLESIPAGGPPKRPREDKLKSYQASVTKSFIQNVLSANLSYAHSDNKSEGFSGLASSGSVSNNTYKRGYSLLTLEYYY